jgi:hypothetical protein
LFFFSLSVDAVGDAVLGGIFDGKLKSLENIVLEILGIFDTAAQAYKVVKDTHSLSLVSGYAGVGHAARQLDEGLDSPQRLGEGEDLGDLAETLGGSVATSDTEREHTSAHAVTVLLEGNGSVRVGVEAGVVDGDDMGGGFEGVANSSSIMGSLASTEVKSLETTMGKP